MGIVEFVAVVVALIALFAWLMGRPHTLASTGRAQRDRIDRGDATGYSSNDSYSSSTSNDTSSSYLSDTSTVDTGTYDACSDTSDSGGSDSGSCDGGGGDGGGSD